MITERRKVLAPGKVFAGKFVLEENFAAGSMGSVWRARDVQRDLQVAIKVMMASLADAPGFVTRFEREASAAAQIGSPHVVSIYEYGVHNQQPYIVMELLRGEDLHEFFKHETRLPLRVAGRIIRGICEGLHGAHESGVIHRDLKPANVYLAREGDAEIVKLLDFGIAKIAQDEGTGITATGQMIGTPHYMSPEQIQGAKHVDLRCDLWAASVIAFRAITGQLPFTGHTVQVIRAILHEQPPAPSSIAPDLSPEVDAFFARAMARNIEDRFQTARELSLALAAMVKKESARLGDTGPTSLAPGSLGDLSPRAGTKPPSSWKARTPPKSDRKSEPKSDRKSEPRSDRKGERRSDAAAGPESLRRVVPVDAELLPVQLRDSAPPSEPSSSSSLSTVPPPLVPSKPPGRRRSWMVWAAAAALVLGTVLFLVLLAGRG